MLDPNLLRTEPDAVAEKLARRGFKLDVDKLRALEERRKVLQVQTENLQAERNSDRNPLARRKRAGKTSSHYAWKLTSLANNWMLQNPSWKRCWRKFAISRWRSRIFLMMMCRLVATKTTTLKLAAGVRRVSSILRCAIM